MMCGEGGRGGWESEVMFMSENGEGGLKGGGENGMV